MRPPITTGTTGTTDAGPLAGTTRRPRMPVITAPDHGGRTVRSSARETSAPHDTDHPPAATATDHLVHT